MGRRRGFVWRLKGSFGAIRFARADMTLSLREVNMILSSFTVMLSAYVDRDQSAILKPISVFFGLILNFFFEITCFFTTEHSLGISIILLTIVTRFLMLPLALKAQKSAAKMQALQPEVEKIKKKYDGMKDTESQRKMTQEIQTLWSKNNVSMFGGCLPLIIQMPLFFALNFVMRQSFLFIGRLGDIYREIGELLYAVNYRFDVLVPLARPHIPKNMELNLNVMGDLTKVLNKFSPSDWQQLTSSAQVTAAPLSIQNTMAELIAQKESMEVFFGINLLENAGMMWPGVLIPIFSALFMFLSSYLMSKQQTTTDPQAKTMQRTMMIFMPLIFGWSTINFPAGVGLYWAVSNVFQIGQQFLLNKFYKPSIAGDKADGKANGKKDEVKAVKDKKKAKQA
jgi:YidC/Oxa1 family membrane protein insertase